MSAPAWREAPGRRRNEGSIPATSALLLISAKVIIYLKNEKKGRPISRVLSRTVIYLGVPFPKPSSSLPADPEGAPLRFLTLLLVRFAVPSMSPSKRWSLTPPFHPYPWGIAPGRFVFCGTFYHPDRVSGCYPVPCSTEPGLSSPFGATV